MKRHLINDGFTKTWWFFWIRLVCVCKRTHSARKIKWVYVKLYCNCAVAWWWEALSGQTLQNRNTTFLSSLYYSRFLPATALPADRNQQDKHTHQRARASAHVIASVNRTHSGFSCAVRIEQKQTKSAVYSLQRNVLQRQTKHTHSTL